MALNVIFEIYAEIHIGNIEFKENEELSEKIKIILSDESVQFDSLGFYRLFINTFRLLDHIDGNILTELKKFIDQRKFCNP